MYKKCGLIILPTKGKSNLFLYKDNILQYQPGSQYAFKDIKAQHLYIISDNDRIKEGDWYLDTLNNLVFPYNKMHGQLPTDKKIIATTDSSFNKLHHSDNILVSGRHSVSNNVIVFPSIPQSFIDKYVSEYNKGNVIKEVLVEYNGKGEIDGTGLCEGTYCETHLKLNPDNTINIKNLKDSWTREEVKTLFDRFYQAFDMISQEWYDEWIKNNL